MASRLACAPHAPAACSDSGCVCTYPSTPHALSTVRQPPHLTHHHWLWRADASVGRGTQAARCAALLCRALTEEDIQPQLTRRRPGQSRLTTPRAEKDLVSILSGTEHGYTLGTPIGLLVPNEDQRPGDYKEMSNIPRCNGWTVEPSLSSIQSYPDLLPEP